MDIFTFNDVPFIKVEAATVADWEGQMKEGVVM